MIERRNPLDFFATEQDTIHDLVRTIDKAAADRRIQGMVLRIETPSAGLAQAMEVRDALARFRTSGKSIMVTADALDLVSYTMVTPATQINLSPVGLLDLRGAAFSLYYFRSMLSKVGVSVDVVHAGDFKDALDPFTRDTMSDATREQMSVLMTDLIGTWTGTLAQYRSMDEALARTNLLGGPYTSRQALERGLIDSIGYPDVITRQWIGDDGAIDWEYSARPRASVTSPSLFSLFSAPTARARRATPQNDTISVAYLIGPIVDGRSDPANPFFVEQVIASEDAIDLLREAIEGDHVKALVVRIDSPGGSAIASDRIWAELRSIRDAGIPVVVSMGNVAASGGYYIAAAADVIVAQPTTITGSIGVVGGKLNLTGLYQQIGVTRETILIGENADLFGDTTEWEGRTAALLDELLGAIYTEFLDRVALGRKLSVDEVRQVAGGRVWSGAAAKKQGLIDELGGLEAAIDRARQLANSPRATTTEFPRELSPFEYLEQLLGGRLRSSIRSMPSIHASSLLDNVQLISPPLASQLKSALVVLSADFQPLTYAPVTLIHE